MELAAQVRGVSGARSWRIADPRARRATAQELWDRHGKAAYGLARALVGDEAAAEAVRLAMADLARSTDVVPAAEARRLLAESVYRHAPQTVGVQARESLLPMPMVWLNRLALLQRASLAMCVFGGLTHREAAAVLDVAPATVAELIIAGLRELSCLATDEPASCA